MTERPERRTPNKPVYKNRWLISADVVAALKRAGIECNIIIAYHDRHLPQHGAPRRDRQALSSSL